MRYVITQYTRRREIRSIVRARTHCVAWAAAEHNRAPGRSCGARPKRWKTQKVKRGRCKNGSRVPTWASVSRAPDRGNEKKLCAYRNTVYRGDN